MASRKILLFVPDGVGIRNYLYSRVFKDCDAKLYLYHNFDPETISVIEKEVKIQKAIEIPDFKEGIWEKFYRELIHLCRLKLNSRITGNTTILSIWKKDRSGLLLRLFYRTIEFASRLFNSYKAILKLENYYEKLLRKNRAYDSIKHQLSSIGVDTLFCTHQRALNAPIIFAAARDLGIRTVTVIYSWDNLPKARLALKADQYLLWSGIMKKQIRQFYPEIPVERLTITGTPQFEFYANADNLIPKDIFYREFGLDSEKIIICFSGDDELTSPNDPLYLRDLAEEIIRNGLDKRYQVLFRRCPVDVSGRYQDVLLEYPELIVDVPPKWNFNKKQWSAVYPSVDDIELLVSVAYYSSVVINVGSTMAFDFGMFGKPCIFINYDQPDSGKWSTNQIYRYEHFKSMPDKGAVLWWNKKEEITRLMEIAQHPGSTSIKSWYDLINKDGATGNIRKALSI